ncbi:MAG TPA: transketolase C-terminal domain-containing protein [Acetobacteraceae bacterium]|nr:transketolase C-terminal domain-containing protein [Acetobacteraceae bacterium]
MMRSKYTRPVRLGEQGEGGQQGASRLTTSAMIASLVAPGQRTKAAPFGQALVELAKSRPQILGLTADLAKYTDLHVFAKAYPDRFYQMGMAEQLLICTAAGMAREGFVPFATTYAVFAARRAYDFICLAIAEENLNVKIACALPGLTTGYGPSHQATEDIAIFRAMPKLTIVSSGFMTMRALEAIKMLQDSHIDVGVLHVPTIKPLDEATILEAASQSGRMVIVAENHTIIGGLGEAVAGLLLRSGVMPAAFRQIALPDEFLDAGALPTLHDRYGISAAAMARSIKGWQ